MKLHSPWSGEVIGNKTTPDVDREMYTRAEGLSVRNVVSAKMVVRSAKLIRAAAAPREVTIYSFWCDQTVLVASVAVEASP